MQKNDENNLNAIVLQPGDIDTIEEKNRTLKSLNEEEGAKFQESIKLDKKSAGSEKKTKEKKDISANPKDPFGFIFPVLLFLIMSGAFYYMYTITNRLNDLDDELFQKTVSLDKAVSKNEEAINNLKSIQESVNKLTQFQQSSDEINRKNDDTFKWLIQTIDELKVKISLMEANISTLNEQKLPVVPGESSANMERAPSLVDTNSVAVSQNINQMSRESVEQIVDNRIAIQIEKLEQKKILEEQKRREEKAKLIQERNKDIAIAMEGIVIDIFEFFKTIYLFLEKNIIYLYEMIRNQI